MDAAELSALAHRYTEAWNAHNAAAVAACFAEGGSFSANDGEPAVGRVAIEKWMQKLFDAFPVSSLTMDGVRGAGDRAVLLWTVEAKVTGADGTTSALRFGGWDAWTLSPAGLVQQSHGNYSHD